MTDAGAAAAPDPSPPPVTPGQAMRAALIERWTARGHCVDGRSWDLLPQVDRDDLDAAAQAAINAAPRPRLADLLAARRERDDARAELERMRHESWARVVAERDQLREVIAAARPAPLAGLEVPSGGTPEATSGEAARKAWNDWWAGAPGRGRGKPGYDEQAETGAAWEVSADAGIGASGLREELAEARRELAEVRELAHNLGDVRRIDELTAERNELAKQLADVPARVHWHDCPACQRMIAAGGHRIIDLLGHAGYDAFRERWAQPVPPWGEAQEAWAAAANAITAAWDDSHDGLDDPGDPQAAVEWAVFYGGPDPDNCAGRETMPDQGMAEVAAQWRVDSGIARRTVAYGPWEVMTREDDGTETAAILADPETMAAIAEGDPDPSVVRDMLLLAGEDIPADRIAGWSPEERAQVAEWAGREHLSASDNPVARRPRPSILAEARDE